MFRNRKRVVPKNIFRIFFHVSWWVLKVLFPLNIPTILFSLIYVNTSLYVIAFMFPRITKSLLLSIGTLTYSLNSENGGLVTTMSACFKKSSIHSSLWKSPSPKFPNIFLNLFADIKRFGSTIGKIRIPIIPPQVASSWIIGSYNSRFKCGILDHLYRTTEQSWTGQDCPGYSRWSCLQTSPWKNQLLLYIRELCIKLIILCILCVV